MSSNIENKRPSWVIPVIGFLVGLLIGWWVIGWWLWPVTWTNALPVDLKASDRDQYLLMVAESYAATRNANEARARLSSWPPDLLAEHLANLQARAASNPQQAAQVQALADLVGAARPSTTGPQPPAAGPPAGQPGAAAGGSTALATLRSIATVVLWLVLLAFAIAAVVYLYRRWRAAYSVQPQTAIDATQRPARSRAPVAHTPAQPTFDEYIQEESTRWVSDEGLAEPEAASDESGEPEIAEVEPQPPIRSPYAPPPAPQRTAPVTPAPAPRQTAQPPATPAAAGGFVKVGDYRALYQMGEADYDEAFDIADVAGGYLGQCGLERNDPVGRGHDQAAAVQAWLWDTNDPDTKVKVLMSDGAYRDTATRDELKGEHEAIAIRPGTEFELETYKLLLRGRVEKADYADQDPPNTIFAELSVRYVVYRKA